MKNGSYDSNGVDEVTALSPDESGKRTGYSNHMKRGRLVH